MITFLCRRRQPIYTDHCVLTLIPPLVSCLPMWLVMRRQSLLQPSDNVCNRLWSFERYPNKVLRGLDNAIIYTSNKEACLSACLNEVSAATDRTWPSVSGFASRLPHCLPSSLEWGSATRTRDQGTTGRRTLKGGTQAAREREREGEKRRGIRRGSSPNQVHGVENASWERKFINFFSLFSSQFLI